MNTFKLYLSLVIIKLYLYKLFSFINGIKTQIYVCLTDFCLQIYGVVPYERLNAKSNIFISYVQMYVVPLFYLTCFGLVSFGSFGVYQQSGCDSICRLGNSLFIHLGLFLYLSTHVLTLWRRKQFFIEFQKSLDDIDVYLRKCDEVGVKKEKKNEPKYLYYGTWFVVIVCFSVAMVYDIKELL